MRTSLAVLGALAFAPVPIPAQAPPWTDLWRVAEGTLVRPAALADGPTGVFWNPAAVLSSTGPAFAADVYQTPDVVNVASVLLGATVNLGRRAAVGLLAGRAAVGDLVRTSTSPIVDGAEIPVYAQFGGAVIGGRLGPLEGGAAVFFHDARLDAVDDGGVTLDAGLRLRARPWLRLAVATHLGDPAITDGASSEVFGGIEADLRTGPVLGMTSRLQARYGFTARDRGSPDHVVSAGLLLAERLQLDAGALWVGGYGTGSWEPLVGVAFHARPFRVGIARGGGASGIGATYRITLGVTATP